MFDSHTLDRIPITNGIGQRDPLSMIIYIIYNADLIDISQGHPNKLILAFVDDTILVVVGKTIEVTHHTLQDMLECTGGGFDWSCNHNSKFETNKFGLINFTPTKQVTGLPMDI